MALQRVRHHWAAKTFTSFSWSITLQRRGQWHPLQSSCLENPMDGGAWEATGHGVAKSQTRLSDFTFTFHFHALEKELATHSSVLAWRIPGTGEPGGLPSVGSHRVGHDWSDLAAAAAALPSRINYSLSKECGCFAIWSLLLQAQRLFSSEFQPAAGRLTVLCHPTESSKNEQHCKLFSLSRDQVCIRKLLWSCVYLRVPR